MRRQNKKIGFRVVGYFEYGCDRLAIDDDTGRCYVYFFRFLNKTSDGSVRFFSACLDRGRRVHERRLSGKTINSLDVYGVYER